MPILLSFLFVTVMMILGAFAIAGSASTTPANPWLAQMIAARRLDTAYAARSADIGDVKG